MGDVQCEDVQADWPALIYRYENGGCSFLAMAFRDLYGWVPLNLGGEHVVAADPDGLHGWDIRGRSALDDLTQRWGDIEPWEPWAEQAFGLSSDPAGDEHRTVARLVIASSTVYFGSSARGGES